MIGLDWIAFGLVIGILARLFMPGRNPGGLRLTFVIGIAGAVIGGFIGRELGYFRPFEYPSIALSLAGAVLVLIAYRVIRHLLGYREVV